MWVNNPSQENRTSKPCSLGEKFRSSAVNSASHQRFRSVFTFSSRTLIIHGISLDASFTSDEDYLGAQGLLSRIQLPVRIVIYVFEASFSQETNNVPVGEHMISFLVAEDVASIWCFDDAGCVNPATARILSYSSSFSISVMRIPRPARWRIMLS